MARYADTVEFVDIAEWERLTARQPDEIDALIEQILRTPEGKVARVQVTTDKEKRSIRMQLGRRLKPQGYKITTRMEGDYLYIYLERVNQVSEEQAQLPIEQAATETTATES